MPARLEPRLIPLVATPGDRFIAELESAWQAGHAVLPVDPAAPDAVTRQLLETMRPDEPVAAEVALVIATSGSTGEPKGAQLSRKVLEASARATHQRIGREPSDVWLSCLPWHHIGGLQVMLRARLLDIGLVVLDRFDPTAVAAARASLLSLVPTQLTRLLDAGVDLSTVRTVLLGGAPASRTLLERARSAGVRVVTTYGMSETAGGCVYDGVPLDKVEVRIGDGGRVMVRGPMVMSGYRCRPDLTEQALVDGWLVTNDHGHLDEAGRLVVDGRADDVIVSGGENVVAGQVADVVGTHPAVREAVVVGVADPQWGQRVVVVAVLDQPVSVAELRDWCADQLPVAALPRALVTVEEIPVLPSGKPDRQRVTGLAEAVSR